MQYRLRKARNEDNTYLGTRYRPTETLDFFDTKYNLKEYLYKTVSSQHQLIKDISIVIHDDGWIDITVLRLDGSTVFIDFEYYWERYS